jgi:hypothetical protein
MNLPRPNHPMQASLEPKNPTVFQTNLDLSYITMWLRNQLFLTLKKKKKYKKTYKISATISGLDLLYISIPILVETVRLASNIKNRNVLKATKYSIR